MKQTDFFTTRWGLILATLGIAVGTGNIWRFSRIVAQNGGGSFLIPWVVFLLLWSVPLIIAEFAIGKSTRFGPIGALSKTAGKKFTWMGAFVAMVSTCIMFYYSVVTGWCIRYFASAVSGDLFTTANHLEYWNQFSSGYMPLVFHLIAIIVCGFILYRGVSAGIEKANKFLVTSLVVIMLMLLVRAVTLPGAYDGIKYFFTPELDAMLNFNVWLNALTQNAWDTGAGWGLILTYAVYMKKKEDIALNAAMIGFGNNSISLIAGITIFSTVFSLSSVDAMTQITQSGPANTGLTFIYLPILFSKMSNVAAVNSVFAALFFLALSFAAISSLMSLMELTTRTLVDFGLKRRVSIFIVAIAGFVFGIPSALSMDFFINQDWVWGVGLILSGAFIAFAVIRYGPDKFRREIINGTGSDVKIGKWYNIVITYLIPIQAVILLVWWLVSSASWDPEWWNPLRTENAGTCLFQWGIVIAVFLLLNKTLTKWLVVKNEN